MANYFNTLALREQLAQLGRCDFMDPAEFADGANYLKGKKLVVIGCGSQGLNQGLNLRDSGLDVSYALRESAISEKRQSWKNAADNGFSVGTYADLIPTADLVLNLTPDKQHTSVVTEVMPMMKEHACLAYSHGFNIVEEGMQVRDDLTVIMVAPKCPGTEVREEYKRGFGVPTLIAVHEDNDPRGEGLAIAKAYAAGTGGHKAGVLMSSFIAEVKSDLMGEQTILCGMLQTGSLLCFDKMVEQGVDAAYAAKLVQYGWETVTEALKHGGVTNMMDRLSNPAKIRAFDLAESLKDIMRPLYHKHMDDIMTGHFSKTMMEDWANDDKNLLNWRRETGETPFETTPAGEMDINDQEYFDHGILMVAMVKAGVELAYETMVSAGIKPESAYYESLHETPLIANTIARKKLFEMNNTISDTAEYGCYLYNHACLPLLADFMKGVDVDVIGKGLDVPDLGVDNQRLIEVNEEIRSHSVEQIGKTLRGYMGAMKKNRLTQRRLTPVMFVQFEDADLKFGEVFSLRNVNWTLTQNEHWVLLGVNGAGKSALAASLAGVGSLTRGKVSGLPRRVGLVSFEVQQAMINAERDLDDSDITDKVFEGTPVRELLFSEQTNADRVRQLVTALSFEDKLDRGFRALSTGETRKLILIKALATDHDLLVLDEPFDGLDKASCAWLRGALSAAAEHTPMVLVLNRLNEVPAFVNRMALVNEGTLSQTFETASGRVPEVLQQILHIATTALDIPVSEPGDRVVPLAPQAPLVVLRQGKVAYGEDIIFQHLDWTVNPGEHWQVVGPNGSGKTCLLNLVTGDHPQCYVNDLSVVGYQRGQGESIWDIKQHIGYVSTALQWEYRVSISLKNVIISGFYDSIGLYQKATDSQAQIALDWLRLLHLDHRADQPFNQCSYGEQRLLLIARAMVKHPQLLILDEPCLGLDEANRRLVLALVEKICGASETTVIYVNHHEEDRVVGIDRVLDMADLT